MLLYLVEMMIWNAACAFIVITEVAFFLFLYYTKSLSNIEGKQWRNQILPPQLGFMFVY